MTARYDNVHMERCENGWSLEFRRGGYVAARFVAKSLDEAVSVIRENAEKAEEDSLLNSGTCRVFGLVLCLLALASPAHADTIQGGPRQERDAAQCSAYRGTWDERNIVLPIGTVIFGPEAPVPAFLSSDMAAPPEQQRATALFDVFTLFDAYYNGAGSLPPAIGYDQLGLMYGVATAQASTGPELPPPDLRLYNMARDPDSLRAFRLANMTTLLSRRHLYPLAVLRAIEDIALQTPTCGGVAY